jgi:branched-chain amino acid transport system substrate-binding protein
VMAKMRALPVEDFFGDGGRIREDGRMVHDLYLVEVKKPEESEAPWDYFRLLKTIPGEQAFRPLAQGGCKLIGKR